MSEPVVSEVSADIYREMRSLFSSAIDVDELHEYANLMTFVEADFVDKG